MKTLKEATDAELQAELSKLKKELESREAAKWQVELKRREKLASVVLTHIDVLLELVPQHGPKSCSDEDHSNADRPCTRCQLLDVKEMDHSEWMLQHLSLQKVI